MRDGCIAGMAKASVPQVVGGDGEGHRRGSLGAEKWVEVTGTIGAKKCSLVSWWLGPSRRNQTAQIQWIHNCHV